MFDAAVNVTEIFDMISSRIVAKLIVNWEEGKS